MSEMFRGHLRRELAAVEPSGVPALLASNQRCADGLDIRLICPVTADEVADVLTVVGELTQLSAT